MSLLTIQNIKLAFGDQALLDNTSFSVEENEKIGLIGRNGAGKSSLLKIIANIIATDDGKIIKKKNIRVAYLAQEPSFANAKTIFDAVATGMEEARKFIQIFQEITISLHDPNQISKHEFLLKELDQHQEAITSIDGWQWENHVKDTLTFFSLDGEKKLSELSGGEAKRVALAQVFVSKPDLLLLDEPTNHLDMPNIQWLEEILSNSNITMVFTSHDRSFLDKISTRILELDRGHIISFPKGYTAYKKRRDQQLALEKIEEKKIDKLRTQEEIWIRQGVEARRTRSISRIRRLENMRLEREQRRSLIGNVKLSLEEAAKSGKIVTSMESVYLTINGNKIVDNLSLTILRGNKLAIVGKNGVGKTTLMQLILGKITPDKGTVKIGTKLEIAYYDQLRTQLNEEATLSEAISPGNEWIELDGNRKHVIAYLGEFLFTPQRARSPVSSLSGGERSRLLLARLFAQKSNLLVLDEPTNDLDIPTLELLEERIAEFNGTVILISHDREFINNIADSILIAHSDGTWEEHIGDLENLPFRMQKAISKEINFPELSTEKKSTGPLFSKKEHNIKKLKEENYNTKILNKLAEKELKNLLKKIENLENQQMEIAKTIEDTNLFISHPKDAKIASEKYLAISENLIELTKRWEVLENISSKNK